MFEVLVILKQVLLLIGIYVIQYCQHSFTLYASADNFVRHEASKSTEKELVFLISIKAIFFYFMSKLAGKKN